LSCAITTVENKPHVNLKEVLHDCVKNMVHSITETMYIMVIVDGEQCMLFKVCGSMHLQSLK
jgi:hypothetical protein